MNTKTKNDTAVATNAGKAPRMTAFRAWGKAEAGATSALLACFVACAEHGETDANEVAEGRGWHGLNADGQSVPNGSAVAYASTFNTAAKAAAIVGPARAKDAIAAAAKLAGKVHVNVANALRAIAGQAKEQGIKEATAAQGRAILKAALSAATDKAAEAKAAKGAPGKPRGTKSPDTATMAAASATSGQDWRHNVAAVRLAANMASRLAMPEGREAAARAYLKALQEAAELGAKLGA